MDSSVNKQDAMPLPPKQGFVLGGDLSLWPSLIAIVLVAIVFSWGNNKAIRADELLDLKVNAIEDAPVSSQPCIKDGVSGIEFREGMTRGEASHAILSLVIRCRQGG